MDYKAQYYKSLYEEQLKKNQYLTKKNTEYFNIITDNEHPPIMTMIENLNMCSDNDNELNGMHGFNWRNQIPPLGI